MRTKVEEHLRVYKARFSKGFWSSLQPYGKPGWATKRAGGGSALRDVAWWDRHWAENQGKAEEGTGGTGERWREKSLCSCLYWHIKQGQDLASNPGLHPLTAVGLAYINEHSPRTTYGHGLGHTTYHDCSEGAVWMQSPYFGQRRKLRSVDASHAGTLGGPENRPWLVLFCNVVLTPGSCQTYCIIWGMQLFWAEGPIFEKVSDNGENRQRFTNSVFKYKTVGACSK